MRRAIKPAIALAFLALFGWGTWRVYDFYTLPFNPTRLADSEMRMWRDYYSGNRMGLGLELVKAVREQFKVGQNDAMEIARDFAGAAVAFQSASGNYESVALPELEAGYERVRKVVGGTWDSGQAARAELEWWVQRRTPGHESTAEVGRSIATLYALLYGRTNARLERAGYLRAEAARVRDQSGDWPRVQKLLRESYSELAYGVR